MGIRCSGDPPLLLAALVYGVSLCKSFAASALYHIGGWRSPWRQRLRAYDHACIFVVIAGTFTPVAFNVLAGWERWTVLAAIWVQAGVGVAVASRLLRLPRGITTALYLSMGWSALVAVPSLVRSLPTAAIAMFAAGGLAYTLGALVYLMRRPNPLPQVFGFHEVFHLCVISGSSAFALAIWMWVIPFPRP
jgi:hemolysin III